MTIKEKTCLQPSTQTIWLPYKTFCHTTSPPHITTEDAPTADMCCSLKEVGAGSGVGSVALAGLQHKACFEAWIKYKQWLFLRHWAGNLTAVTGKETLKHRFQNLLPQERPPTSGPSSCDIIRGLWNTCWRLVFIREAHKQHIQENSCHKLYKSSWTQDLYV